MKQYTEGFRNNLKTLGRQIDAIITYTLNGTQHIIDASKLLSISPIIQGGILKSVMKQLDFESTEEVPIGTIVKLQIGLQVDNTLTVQDVHEMQVKRLNELPVNLLAVQLNGFEYLDFGNYIIKDEPTYNADTNSYSYICYDKMLYSMIDYEDMNIVYPITIKNYINTICTKLGLTFKDVNNTFANYDKQIQNELYLTTDGKSLGYTFRDVLDELAQVTASTICINEITDELEIRYITETNDSIDEEFLKDINVQFKDKYGPINMIVLSRADADNVYYPNSIPQNPCEIKIVNNQILNWDDRETYMPDIYNKLNGLEYYINDFNSTGILWYELCDMYNINIGQDTYKCVLLNDEINIQQGLVELIHTDMPEESVTDYHTADTSDKKVKQTIFQVNKQEGQIKTITSEIGDRSEKTTTITQDIDGIASAVQDIEDLTNTVSAIKTISITDAYPNNDILELHIYGNNSVFDYLYPDDDLYPDDSLLPYGDSKIRFYNNVEDRTINLGILEVLRANTDVKDEVAIDYQGNVSLIRRVNADGTTKPMPVTTQLGTLHFTLVEGTNIFEIVNYNAVIEVKYTMKSNFTEIFATKVEMSSSITQTADKINAEVRKKVGENEIISKINLSPENIQIEADKISLAGKAINLSADGISINSENFSVTPNGVLTAKRANINGVVQHYSSSNGYLSIKLDNNMMQMYDWKNNGIGVGSISSTYTQSTNMSGIAFIGIKNKRLTIGYKEDMEDTDIISLFDYNPIAENALPYIKNTASGTLFSGLSGGGIQVQNGLIKTWNMSGAWSGTFNVSTPGGTYKLSFTSGLLTGVDIV